MPLHYSEYHEPFKHPKHLENNSTWLKEGGMGCSSLNILLQCKTKALIVLIPLDLLTRLLLLKRKWWTLALRMAPNLF